MNHENLSSRFVRTAKRCWGSLCAADSTGRSLTFGRALAVSLVLSRWLARRTRGETHIGLLLPASVAGALANIATVFTGKVVVNLNFTAGPESMAHAISCCGIKTIITSRQFLSKVGLDPTEGMIFMEDVMKEVSRPRIAAMLVVCYLLPAPLLTRLFLRGQQADETAAVIFSSGSTGLPKGVVLTHYNLLANIDAVTEVFDVTCRDIVLGVLPFFHSFGFTGTLWFPLIAGFGAVYHPNPMDAKTIGELAEQYRVTLLMGTSTFCATYVRKCRAEAFAHLRFGIVGAEKLREPVAAAFREKFQLDLLEGYGMTEMAPIVSVNAPDIVGPGGVQVRTRKGSVGRPMPGIEAKIVDLDTGEGPLIGREGLLLVNGPNRMQGYLNDPERTSEAFRDGWYVTGDIATIDDDGFIFITDRLARFSKIAGEMVPHLRIEEAIAGILGDIPCVVTAIPDESRGERLVAFHASAQMASEVLWGRLSGSDLPKLWIPKRENIYYLEALPVLGSGKVDLKGLRELAVTLANG